MKELDAEKTNIKLSLPALAGALGFLGSFITGIVIFGITTKSTADAAQLKATQVEVDLKSFQKDVSENIRVIRESQIRMETRLGEKNQ